MLRGSPLTALRGAMLAAVIAFPARAAVRAQTLTLTGSVVDEAGKPIRAATVTVSCDGSTGVSATDEAGEFEITIPPAAERCGVVISRFGFRSASTTVRPGLFVPRLRLVLQKEAMWRTLVLGASEVRPGLRPTLVTELDRTWRISSTWVSGGAADDVRSRTLQRLAGGERWQTQTTLGYTGGSGFRVDGGIVARRGYQMPLFMSRPFGDATALPELFAPANARPEAYGVQWNALFTLNTPATRLRGIDISGSMQAFMQLSEAPKGFPSTKDRGVRASLHFKFK